jgi:hypothetical protein
MAMIIFTAMIVKAKTIIMAMTIEPYESIAYTRIPPPGSGSKPIAVCLGMAWRCRG